MTFRTYIKVTGEISRGNYHNKRSDCKKKKVKCPECGSYCKAIWYRDLSKVISVGYICLAHTPNYVFIKPNFKFLTMEEMK